MKAMNIKGTWATLTVVGLLGAIGFMTIGTRILDLDTGEADADTVAPQGSRVESPLPDVASLESAFIEVAEHVNPAVVQIQSRNTPEEASNQPSSPNPFENTPYEDFWDYFNPRTPWTPQPRSGLGSGVILRPDGYVLTNNHVVADSDELTVITMDGSTYEAEIVGADVVSDVAVIKIEMGDLPYISMGDSDEIRVGQWVMAFGSPIDPSLGNTVTAGIVSATSRIQRGPGSSEPQNGSAIQPTPTHDFIQTDAAINPGNSGGPLVNLRGELVGINTAIITRTGGNQGIGFAIPVNTVRHVSDQLIATGRVERARLGVGYGPATESLIEVLDLPRGSASVTRVEPGSAAEEAGLREGDVITHVNGEELTNHQQLSLWIGRMKPGDQTEIVANRDGEEHTFQIRLGGWQETAETLASEGAKTPTSSVRDQLKEELGLTLSDLTDPVAEQAGFEEDVEGVIVTGVDPSSYAAREAQLRRGAVIVEIDRKPVRNLKEFEDTYADIEAGRSFLVRLRVPDGGAYVTALKKPDSQ